MHRYDGVGNMLIDPNCSVTGGSVSGCTKSCRIVTIHFATTTATRLASSRPAARESTRCTCVAGGSRLGFHPAGS
jgi:hypothetical protein